MFHNKTINIRGQGVHTNTKAFWAWGKRRECPDHGNRPGTQRFNPGKDLSAH
jgi:hypothetical protein